MQGAFAFMSAAAGLDPPHGCGSDVCDERSGERAERDSPTHRKQDLGEPRHDRAGIVTRRRKEAVPEADQPAQGTAGLCEERVHVRVIGGQLL